MPRVVQELRGQLHIKITVDRAVAMSQCMLTKQYGKYKAVIQFSAVDRPETEEKVLSLIMGAYAERRCASVN